MHMLLLMIRTRAAKALIRQKEFSPNNEYELRGLPPLRYVHQIQLILTFERKYQFKFTIVLLK